MATFDSSSISDYLVLYDTGDSGVVGYAFILTPYEKDGLLSVYQQQGTGFSSTPCRTWGHRASTHCCGRGHHRTAPAAFPGTRSRATSRRWVERAPSSLTSGTVTNIADLPAKGDNSVAVWLQNDQYTVNLLDSNGTLHTIQQTGPGAFADPMPISNGVPGTVTPGLVTVSGVPTDPTRATLFAVGADETLSVLSLDDAGWNQTQLHQDHVVGVQLTSYRVKITVRDASSTPVRYAQAQIGTDRPVGLWQDIGSTIITPAATVTMTADILGEISFSVPAEELDAAVLTVQALDGSGNATGSALSVTADYDVRNFMGGTAVLDNVGSMSANTLQTAKNPDGTNLLPGSTTPAPRTWLARCPRRSQPDRGPAGVLRSARDADDDHREEGAQTGHDVQLARCPGVRCPGEQPGPGVARTCSTPSATPSATGWPR